MRPTSTTTRKPWTDRRRARRRPSDRGSAQSMLLFSNRIRRGRFGGDGGRARRIPWSPRWAQSCSAGLPAPVDGGPVLRGGRLTLACRSCVRRGMFVFLPLSAGTRSAAPDQAGLELRERRVEVRPRDELAGGASVLASRADLDQPPLRALRRRRLWPIPGVPPGGSVITRYQPVSTRRRGGRRGQVDHVTSRVRLVGAPQSA